MDSNVMSDRKVEAAAGSTPSRRAWVVWTGRVLSALVVLLMLFSAAMKLARPPDVVQAFVTQFGYPESTLLPIAILEIACALIYATSPTAALGAVLLTGYLGGAVATMLRVGQNPLLPALVGAVAWLALYLRDLGVRELLPLRRSTGAKG